METELLVGRVSKALLKFSIPVFLSMFIQSLYSTIDMIVIGYFMGKNSISAISVGGLIIYVAQVFVTGLISGVTIVIARNIGKNDLKKVRSVIGSSVIFFVLVSLVMTVVMLLSSKFFANIMNTPQESFKQTISYVNICSIGLSFTVAFNLISGIFRGTGDSKSPFRFAIYSCLFNIVGDICLVGVLRMGVEGAAIATITAQAFSAIISYISLKKKHFMKEFSKENIGIKKENYKAVCNIIKLGLPLGLQDALVQISFVLVQRVVNGMGVDYSASYGVGIKILGYILLVPTSFMITLSTFVSQNVGANKTQRAKEGLYSGIKISLVIGVLTYVIAFFEGNNLSRLFVYDSTVVNLAAQFLKGIAIDGITLSFLYCYCGYFNGYGKSKFVMIQGILGAFLIRVPLAYIFKSFHSIFLIGLATPISSFVQVILCLVYYKYLIRNKEISGSDSIVI